MVPKLKTNVKEKYFWSSRDHTK